MRRWGFGLRGSAAHATKVWLRLLLCLALCSSSLSIFDVFFPSWPHLKKVGTLEAFAFREDLVWQINSFIPFLRRPPSKVPLTLTSLIHACSALPCLALPCVALCLSNLYLSCLSLAWLGLAGIGFDWIGLDCLTLPRSELVFVSWIG